MKNLRLVFTSLMLLAMAGLQPHAQQPPSGTKARAPLGTAAGPPLTPTNHPPLPRELSQLWLAPARGSAAGRPSSAGATTIAAAAQLQSTGDYAKSLTIVSQPALQQGPLADYAAYYAAVAQLRLGRAAEARGAFQVLAARQPLGYLSEAAAFGEADAALALNDAPGAVAIYERLLKGKPSSLDDTVLRLGRAARAAGDLPRAEEAFNRVYYEFALSPSAQAAGTELAVLAGRPVMAPGSQRFRLELGRAERMFGAKHYAAAEDAFDAIAPFATGDDKELVRLRLAECDYFQKNFRNARAGVRPYLEHASRRAEALFFYAASSRELGDDSEFLRTVKQLVDEFPTQTWTDEGLNTLATYYLLRDRDDEADVTFRDLYEKFPRGNNAERAAWKAGWRAYRDGQYGEAVHFFEGAAADFTRSDYRPAWLYWSGRALERSGDVAAARERYGLVTTDYLNSYYGRLAVKRLKGAVPAADTDPAAAQAPDSEEGGPLAPSLPPNATVIRALLAADMYDDALNELRYAQKVWGDLPAIPATVAWVQQQQSRGESGMRRFQLLRGAINTMRRAYPQYMAAGGEELPRDVLTVIFPLAYWDLIRKHAAAHDLDPYLVAALVAQESTFVADIRSHANAYGLMQLMPATARQYARKLKLRYSAQLLTDPEANIRMGTSYLADKIQEFGDLPQVLASYNAGESPVRRWRAERPGLEGDEFVDDIPYPETQTYVKKILGTAEDYRRLYSGQAHVRGLESDIKPAAPATRSAPAPRSGGARRPSAKAPSRKAPAAKAPVRKAAPNKKTPVKKRK